jgi:hypothetical protein
MTEPTEQEPVPDPVAEPPAAPPAKAAAPRYQLLPWLTGAGFLILVAGLFWVWRYPAVPPQSADQTDAMVSQLSALEARVARLEQRPQAADLRPLTARVTALEQRPAQLGAGSAAQTPDLAPLQARVSALEQRQPANLVPLETRIAALESRQPADSQLAARITALESAEGSMQTRLATSDKAARHMALLQAAGLALAAGQKLGAVPGAPPALARFADASPPTEAALRLAFPPAAREALASAHPVTEGRPLLARLWAQAQDLVTVRQGDHVLLGDPTAGVLERARAALDAGDLSAAATEVASLQGAPAQAMAAWLSQARALLEARAALAAWAASG